ncbi:interaptin-like isoform X2 [Argopecten irradians]|uniref:interaptin-like isoform X2 n=1 Tax=Argopecten irradians TaxID=31199 RepID=UPI003721D3C9
MASPNRYSSYSLRSTINTKNYSLPMPVAERTKLIEEYYKAGTQVGVQSTSSLDGDSCQAAKQSNNVRNFVCSRCRNTEETQFPKYQHESAQDFEKEKTIETDIDLVADRLGQMKLEDETNIPNKEVKDLKSQIEQLQNENNALQGDLQSLRKENEELNKDKQSNEGTIYYLERKVHEEKTAVQQLQTDTKGQIGEKDRMMQQMKEDFEKREVNYVKQIGNLEQEVKEVNDEKTDLRKALRITKEKMEGMSFVKTSFTTEQVDETQSDEKNVNLDEHNDTSDSKASPPNTDDCELKKEHLREEMKTPKEKNEELQKARELHLLKNRNEQCETTIGLLSGENEQLQKCVESLKRDHERKECEHKQQLADLRSHISMLTSQNSKLEEEQGVSKTRMEAMEREAKEEKLQTIDLQKQKEEEIKLLGMNLEQITKLTSDFEGQKEEIKSLGTQVSKLAEEKTKLALDLMKEKDENKEVKCKEKKHGEKYTKLRSELDHQKGEIKQFKEQVETLEAERTKLSSELEDHKKITNNCKKK